MKRIMTNEQIDEINDLLVDHGGAITAFVDEMSYNTGLNVRTKIGIIAPIVIVASGFVGALIHKVTNTKKLTQKEVES